MDSVLDIYVHEDDSVRKKLTDRAIKLQKKYYKKRKINEKIIKKKTPLQKAVSIVFDTACILVAVVCGLICFCNVSSRFQNLTPSIAGFSTMRIASGSMVNSGYQIGDAVVIQAVDTDTLKVGDNIAFYVYAPSYRFFNKNNATVVDTSAYEEKDFVVSVTSFLGIQNKQVQTAAKAQSKRVFHEIIEVYEDAKGERWFKTKGTSNPLPDSWIVNENYVLGSNNDSDIAKFMAAVINGATSSMGSVTVLVVPLIIIAMFIVGLSVKDVQLAMLENDIVEEKRKLTDDICVKNKIGYQLSPKAKYKVLATATPDEKMKYISLLWKDGKTPNALKKYYLRKKLLIKPMEEMRDLNRKCEKMFEDGENPKTIAKFYEDEKKRINDKYENNKKKIKNIKQNNQEESVA